MRILIKVNKAQWFSPLEKALLILVGFTEDETDYKKMVFHSTNLMEIEATLKTGYITYQLEVM
jgi:hypothetical protein